MPAAGLRRRRRRRHVKRGRGRRGRELCARGRRRANDQRTARQHYSARLCTAAANGERERERERGRDGHNGERLEHSQRERYGLGDARRERVGLAHADDGKCDLRQRDAAGDSNAVAHGYTSAIAVDNDHPQRVRVGLADFQRVRVGHADLHSFPGRERVERGERFGYGVVYEHCVDVGFADRDAHGLRHADRGGDYLERGVALAISRPHARRIARRWSERERDGLLSGHELDRGERRRHAGAHVDADGLAVADGNRDAKRDALGLGQRVGDGDAVGHTVALVNDLGERAARDALQLGDAERGVDADEDAFERRDAERVADGVAVARVGLGGGGGECKLVADGQRDGHRITKRRGLADGEPLERRVAERDAECDAERRGDGERHCDGEPRDFADGDRRCGAPALRFQRAVALLDGAALGAARRRGRGRRGRVLPHR